MNQQDRIEAERRRTENAFNMLIARRRYRAERVITGMADLPFRGWARRTYNPTATAGKLSQVVAGK